MRSWRLASITTVAAVGIVAASCGELPTDLSQSISEVPAADVLSTPETSGDGTIRIVTFGDSNTDVGFEGTSKSVKARSYVSRSPNLEPDAPHSPFQLAGKLERRWSELRGTPFKAVNHGITGTSSGDGRASGSPNARLVVNGVTRYEAEVLGVGAPNWDGGESMGSSFPEGPIVRVNAYVPDARSFAYVSMGTNDIGNGRTVEATILNLEWMVDGWLATGQDARKFILTTLPPLTAGSTRGLSIPPLNDGIRALAARTGVHLLDLAAHVSDDNGLTWRAAGLHVGDQLHYSEVVREWIAQEVVRHIDNVLPTTPVAGAPTAAFTVDPPASMESEGRTFDATSSTDPSGSPLTYSWSFGDGTTGSGPIVTHPYVDNGSYTVVLTVTNAAGLEHRTAVYVDVENAVPVVNAGADRRHNAAIRFNYSPSFTDLGTRDATWVYTVDWGDGATSGGGTSSRGTLSRLSHDYGAPGVYTVRVNVRDKDGGVGSDEMVLTVEPNVAPVASLDGPYAGKEGSTIKMSAAASADANGDVLIYRWDFGDGMILTGTKYGSVSKKYLDNGNYTVTLTVTDPVGASSTATTTAVISNVAPVSRLTVPSSIVEGAAYSVTLALGSDVGLSDRPTLEYALDCGLGDGFTEWSATILSIQCPVQPDQRSITTRGKVRDKDGGETAYSGTVKVLNAMPVVTFAATSATTFAAGGALSVEGSFTDAGIHDSDWSYTILWGDGTTSVGTLSAQGPVALPGHTYVAPGTFSAQLRIRDKDGSTGASAFVTVTVTPASQ